MAQIILAQGTSQATPPTGYNALYAKTDGGLYYKNSQTGVETACGVSGGGTGTVTNVSVASANGFAGTVATSSTTPAITISTSVSGILKGNGTSVSTAASGTDYAPATSGAAILYGNGAGGFSSVTIGTNLTFSGGVLNATGGGGMVYPGAGIPNSSGAAWGTSYSTTGSGTVVVLATSPTLVTPVLGTPTSGNLSNCTADGTNAVGFLQVPQNSQSVAYQTVLSDGGKHILHPSADTTARTFTIPANATVAYPIGTAITFVNQNAAGVVTIAITTDTMRLAGAGTTGSRTLAANGVATALKITSTEWIISGTGLT